MERETASIRFSRLFVAAFIVVMLVTVVSFFALTVFYPIFFSTPLSELEQRALKASDWGLKSGLGALGGLVTGKFGP